jgi:hypothetical protein
MQQDLIAGDSLNFLTAGGDYPASSGWELTYHLTPRGAGSNITITATAEGDDHRVAVAAATTANWTAGAYGWASRVSKAGEVYTLERGQITIAANPAAIAAGTDTRSAAEVALANVQAYLRGQATAGVLRYRINGREIERYSIEELVKLEQRLTNQVAADRRAAGLDDKRGTVRRILVRMR